MVGSATGKASELFFKIDEGQDSNEIKLCWDMSLASSIVLLVSSGTEVEGGGVETRDVSSKGAASWFNLSNRLTERNGLGGTDTSSNGNCASLTGMYSESV